MNNRYVKFTLISTGILVGILLLLFGATELTSKPAFCSNCHFMQPYVEGWETSTHSEVTCTACHFPPGFKSKIKGKFTAASMVVNYFTGVYKKSKPWAEISDESCLRSGCHAERLLKDEIVFKEGILFKHKPHLNELRRNKKLRCTSCHSQVVQGTHISVTETTCFLCHFKNAPDDKEINDCTWCHDAPVKTETQKVSYDHTVVYELDIGCKKCHGDMQIGDGVVPRERCSSCHAEIEKIEKYDDDEFMHKKHVADHKVECEQCHLSIQHKSVDMAEQQVPDCESCHTNTHAVQYGLYSGQIGRDINPHPDKMFTAGLTCQACHLFHETFVENELDETIAQPTGESCEKCHGEGYNDLFQQWQRVMEEKLSIVKHSLDTVNESLDEKSIPSLLQLEISPILDRAHYNFNIVSKGNIVHNVAFSDQLLTKVSRDLMAVIQKASLGVTIPDFSQYSQVIPSECSNCHIAVENIQLEFEGVGFSHDGHIANGQVSCSQCHSNAVSHGETIVDLNDCSSCHHEESENFCQECHIMQASVYEGSADWIDDPYADIMYDEEVECMDCHTGEPMDNEELMEYCAECHDEEEVEMLESWQDDFTNQMEELSQLIATIPDYNLDNPNYMKIITGIMNLRKDGSKSVHNHVLIMETLQSYESDLQTMTQ